MSIIEAIQKANAFVLQNTGVTGEPDFVRLVESPDKRRSWRLVYNAKLFFPNEPEGTVIDGGEYVVTVDLPSGIVRLLG